MLHRKGASNTGEGMETNSLQSMGIAGWEDSWLGMSRASAQGTDGEPKFRGNMCGFGDSICKSQILMLHRGCSLSNDSL